MNEVLAELLKAFGLMVIGFIGGLGACYLKNRAKEQDFERRQRELQASEEADRKKRRLIGSGEVEKVGRANSLADLMIKLKEHDITPEQFHEQREKLIMGRGGRKRGTPNAKPVAVADQSIPELPPIRFQLIDAMSKDMPAYARAYTADAVMSLLNERGPNHGPVGYDSDQNKCEWLPDADVPGDHWSQTLLRNGRRIAEAAEEYFEKLWWARHQLGVSKESYDPEIKAEADATAARIAAKYNLGNINMNDTDYDTLTRWGEWTGKLSALRWVTGSDWDFVDT